MDMRTRKPAPFPKMKPAPTTTPVEEKKMEYGQRYAYPQGPGHGRRIFPVGGSYFSVESLLVLICLTASLLILPLILPPLPPPPFMLLLIPIGILALLMILAFMSADHVRDF